MHPHVFKLLTAHFALTLLTATGKLVKGYESAVHLAVRYGQAKALEVLINEGHANVNVMAGDGIYAKSASPSLRVYMEHTAVCKTRQFENSYSVQMS